MNLEQLVYIPFHVAPGVYIRVIDEIYPDVSHPEKYNALFFIASPYGPANKLVPITSEEQFLRTFGTAPMNYPWSSMMAQNHAKYATAYCIRLLPYDATEANLMFAITPLYVADLIYKPDLIPQNDLHADTINDIDNYNNNQNTSVLTNIVKLNDGSQVFVIRYGNYNHSIERFEFTIDNNIYSAVLINDLANIPQNSTIYAINIISFSELGSYYNKMSIGLRATLNNTFDLIFYYNINQNNNVIIASLPNRSFFKQLDEYGTDVSLENNKYYAKLLYTSNDIAIQNIKIYNDNIQRKLLIYKLTAPNTYTRQFIDIKDIDTIKGGEFARSIFYIQDRYQLKYGADGSLIQNTNNGEVFNYNVFASMVADALYGRSKATGYNNSYLAEPIYDLLDEELFIKYIYDPTDHRFSLQKRNEVHIALYDFAKQRYFSNSGALVMANLSPIEDPFDKNELDNKLIVRSELFTVYVSQFEGIYNGVSYDKYPQLLLVARDLIQYRAGKGQYDSFAGPIVAQHAGIKKILRKYTLAERDILTLNGLNYLVSDLRYGKYTDLNRTTYPFNSALRWAYVVEDLIDIKYELKVALKPYLHKLETFDWRRLIRRIENLIFKPRANRGLLKEYKVDMVTDETYLLQNILPIIVTVKYARSMERISVTIYVK
ncbi:MAG: hypothetical protein QXS19_06465 [Candidatus Methanomethylicia archaeon]